MMHPPKANLRLASGVRVEYVLPHDLRESPENAHLYHPLSAKKLRELTEGMRQNSVCESTDHHARPLHRARA